MSDRIFQVPGHGREFTAQREELKVNEPTKNLIFKIACCSKKALKEDILFRVHYELVKLSY